MDILTYVLMLSYIVGGFVVFSHLFLFGIMMTRNASHNKQYTGPVEIKNT